LAWSQPRIGIFTRPIDQGFSGSGHHLLEIVRNVLARNQDRFHFTLIHYEKNDLPIYTQSDELIVPRNPIAASRVLRRLKFDILHYAPLSPYAPIWRVPGKKVATMHGAEPYLVPELYGPAHRFHAMFTKPRLARRMDHIITVSKTSRDFLAGRFRIPRERFTVCYNAVGTAYRRLTAEEVTAPARFGVDGPYVLHMSNFSERKNPETVIRGFAAFARAMPDQDYRLVLAGNRWRNPRTERLVSELAIEERVCFPGFVTERDAVELLSGAFCFLFPSLAEGFGMPNVEAMACGCPVVTSGVFAIPEIVADAALVLPDPRDWSACSGELQRLAQDETLRSTLVKRGLSRAAEFSWAQSAEAVLSVYEQLIRSAGVVPQ
jgi:glycosyltransferase involved in cell wall biosynthesis